MPRNVKEDLGLHQARLVKRNVPGGIRDVQNAVHGPQFNHGYAATGFFINNLDVEVTWVLRVAVSLECHGCCKRNADHRILFHR